MSPISAVPKRSCGGPASRDVMLCIVVGCGNAVKGSITAWTQMQDSVCPGGEGGAERALCVVA